MTFDRDTVATEALLTDLYLDALLAGAALSASAPAPAAGRRVHLDPIARRAAERLRRDLVRVHPSFRFEERLATRLAEAAVAMREPLAAGAEGRVVALRPLASAEPDPAIARAVADPPVRTGGANAPAAAWLGRGSSTDPAEAGVDPARRPAGRPLLIGGALTSAALSIAGAALVAWRLGRSGRASTPMARAARAVRSGAPGGPSLRGPGRSSRTPAARGLD